jgi:hypothetical protein
MASEVRSMFDRRHEFGKPLQYGPGQNIASNCGPTEAFERVAFL